MRIRELRAKAREDAQGSKMKVVLPVFIMLLITYLIELIPPFIADGTSKNVAEIITKIVSFLLIIPLSYSVMIRMLKVARKEQISGFVDDIFGEGMRNGWSCAWGIFTKIWYWLLLIVVGYVLIGMGIVSLFSAQISGGIRVLDGTMESDIIGTNSLTGASAVFGIVGFILIILSAIKITVASYKYFLVTYLKHDYPDKSTKELLEKSKEMMDGNKAKAFVIPLTFIGWIVLSIICCVGLGVVWSIFELISQPQMMIYGSAATSTVPVWVTILMSIIINFIISFVIAYLQMTYAEFYLERNPLEIYNEDYEKPETNAKKYKRIIGFIYGIIIGVFLLLPLCIIIIGGINNTPYDAKFAYFCQEYDRIQTGIQLKYYDKYAKYLSSETAEELPISEYIYAEIANPSIKATSYTDGKLDTNSWMEISENAWGSGDDQICEKPSLDGKWFICLDNGNIVYEGFEREPGKYYYAPNKSGSKPIQSVNMIEEVVGRNDDMNSYDYLVPNYAY